MLLLINALKHKYHHMKRKHIVLRSSILGAIIFDFDIWLTNIMSTLHSLVSYHNIVCDFFLSMLGLLGFFVSLPIDAVEQTYLLNHSVLRLFVRYSMASIIGALTFVIIAITWRSIFHLNDYDKSK